MHCQREPIKAVFSDLVGADNHEKDVMLVEIESFSSEQDIYEATGIYQ